MCWTSAGKRGNPPAYARGSQVSAVIVTRGDVDLGAALTPVLTAGGVIDEVIVRRGDGGVWERWDAAASAKNDVIYTQDDDCVVEVDELLNLWPAYCRRRVICNMPEWKRGEYRDGIALVGWGAVFHRSALEAFARYRQVFPEDDAVFRREADRVFTGLNDPYLADVPFSHLPWATGKDRMGAQAEHGAMLTEIRRRIGVVREQIRAANERYER